MVVEVMRFDPIYNELIAAGVPAHVVETVLEEEIRDYYPHYNSAFLVRPLPVFSVPGSIDLPITMVKLVYARDPQDSGRWVPHHVIHA